MDTLHRCQDSIKPYALNETFGDLMDQKSVGALHGNGQILEREHKRWTREQQDRSCHQSLGDRISRLLMHYMGQFCLVDLYGAGRWSRELNQLESSEVDSCEFPKWARAIKCIYYYCVCKVLVTLYYQYSYDFNLTRSERLRLYLVEGGANSSRNPPKFYTLEKRFEYLLTLPEDNVTNQTITNYDNHQQQQQHHHHQNQQQFRWGQLILSQYEINLAHAKAMLRLLGAPYMHMRFSIECTYIFFLLISLGLYIQTQLFFTYVHPFDFALVRSIMDFKRELRISNKLIRCELNKFIESSRVFTCIVLDGLVPYKSQGVSKFTTSCPSISLAKFTSCCAFHSGNAQRNNLWRLNDTEIRRVLKNHLETIEQLERMALSGHLMPVNKQHKWVRHFAHTHCFYTTAYLVYCVTIAIIMAVVVPNQLGATLETEPMDLVSSLELLFLVFVVNTSSTFYGSIVLATSLDQVNLVRELKLKFEQTLRVNEIRFRSGWLVDCSTSTGAVGRREMALKSFAKQSTQTSDPQWGTARDLLSGSPDRPGRRRRGYRRGSPEVKQVDIAYNDDSDYAIMRLTTISSSFQQQLQQQIQAEMDSDLLRLLISYKIFVTQLASLRRSYGFVTLTTYTLMILMPIIGRVHVPYVDGRIKLYVGLLSLLCTFACDLIILIPVAYLYTRCIELHKILSSILAHTIEVSQAAAAATRRRTTRQFKWIGYNEHTVFALRKELRDPERLVEQFATTMLGIKLTYSNLLRIHFWIGFITQSFLFESSISASSLGEIPQDLFGSIFADPLGLR